MSCQEYQLLINGSSCELGAMLTQEGKDITYVFRTLNTEERNKAVTGKEYLAVLKALEKFKSYFTEKPIRLVIKHRVLERLRTGENPSAFMILWTLKIEEYHYRASAWDNKYH